MKPFAYERADDVAGAVAALARPGARLLAGGTNLVDLMKLGVEQPDVLVDVQGLGLTEVEDLPDGGLRIGAGVRNSDLAADERVRRRFPVLSRALLAGATGQLRNRATTAGNLLQRTRCVYFADTSKPCNKREPGSGCPARTGLNRELAVLGWSDACVATHPGDMAVALTALDAVVHVQTPDGGQTTPMTSFHRLPGDEPQRDTVLPDQAVITAVEVPGLALSARSTYRKARDRASYAYALASVAASLQVEDGRVADVRLVLGGVAHRPWRAERAEQALRGGPATGEAYAAAVATELEQARPLSENAYKVPLLQRLAVGVLDELGQEQA